MFICEPNFMSPYTHLEQKFFCHRTEFSALLQLGVEIVSDLSHLDGKVRVPGRERAHKIVIVNPS